MSSDALTSNQRVHELRQIAQTIETNGGWHIAALKVRDAADRLEQSDAVLTQWREALEYVGNLNAEIERLRAVLSQMAEKGCSSRGDFGCREIASKALRGSSTVQEGPPSPHDPKTCPLAECPECLEAAPADETTAEPRS